MSKVAIPSTARAYGPARQSRIAAPLALLLLTAACGGGGGGGGPDPQGPTGPVGTFVAPHTPLALAMGGSFAVHVTGLPPGAPVVVTLDTDGNPATAGDTHVLAGALLASATGEVQATVSTDGLPAGDHRLLAVRAGSTEVLAAATEPVSLAPGGRLVWLASSASETIRFAKPMANGRVALAGHFSGEAGYATSSGPVTLPGSQFQDAFTAVLDGETLVGVEQIGGQYYETLTDLAVASPVFCVVGTSAFSLPQFSQPTAATPPAGWEGATAGFAGIYDDECGYATSLLTWGHSTSGVPAHNVQATALTYASDGSRLLALSAQSNFWVGGLEVPRPGTIGGSVIVRVRNNNRADPPFAVIEGLNQVTALEFDANGDLLVAGTGEGYLSFGPFDALPGGAFVARYDASGTCLGVVSRTAGTGRTTVRDMSIGADGTVYVVGDVYGPTTFGPVTFDPALGGTDGYVLALAPNLAPRWGHAWRWWTAPAGPSAPGVTCTGVAALPGGGCAVAGRTPQGADIGHVRVGNGLSDQEGAVARYGQGGDLAWVLTVGGTGPQDLEGLAVDAAGCLLIPGGTFGPLALTDRDGTTVHPAVTSGTFDGFLLRLDPDGRVR